MKHKITFYPIGNADTTLIELNNGDKILFDYANMRCADDEGDKRIDLPAALNKAVLNDFAAVAFTHLDKDHTCGFSEYFYLEHAEAYQSEDRKKIKELWVPAAILIETDLTDEYRVLRAEARYRLVQKKGIRVFSRHDKLKEWCDNHKDICFEDIEHLLVDAGTLIPGFTKTAQGVEFFVHSPFMSTSQDIDRNNEAIVVQATFNDDCETKVILGSDLDHAAWADIVKITRHFGNDSRLSWDLFHISHHCSYTALNAEKGEEKTVPTPEVKWLFETMGNERSRIISPSWSIPTTDTTQPPHRQASAYYKSVAEEKKGEFKVTMDHPSASNPKPLTYTIDSSDCARLLAQASASATFASERKPSRAGHDQ
jgi:beta-lactamase superfamily II metal-dependent hydrolase